MREDCARRSGPIVDHVSTGDVVGDIAAAKACDAAVNRAEDIIDDVRTAYDGGAYGTAPVKGDATATAALKSHNGTKATCLEAGAAYDAYGRELKVTEHWKRKVRDE